MAFAHPMLILQGYGCCRSVFLDEQQRNSVFATVVSLTNTGNAVSRVLEGFPSMGSRSRRRFVIGHGRSFATELQTVPSGDTRTGIEIHVTCYQILGIPDQAEKDEIVKSVMDLKNAEIEEGYTLEAVVSRQDILMDVRDKLLFEPEYAGNSREKIPPKSLLRIPWVWLPGVLCLLQEVGEEKLVLEIGRAALQHPDAKPHIHDLLLSMALSECAIAKRDFEKNNVSQGFEALARAQYLLRSKISLGKVPLLSQIEESLEELAPACTLELLGMPHTPENAERRRGAIAALHELLRQGLDAEASCRVKDWACFLCQALNRLMAAEIVDLMPWDTLAITRKNKKSLESQNQRVIIDFNCFYMVMIAHIALGFLSKQTYLINKAKDICESLAAAEGMDLKFEETFCSFLLGEGDGTEAAERLYLLESNSTHASLNSAPAISGKEIKNSCSTNNSLETWLKDAVLGVFPDTRDCSPFLANFFSAKKKVREAVRHHSKGSPHTLPNVINKPPSYVSTVDHTASKEPRTRSISTQLLGQAMNQFTPANVNSTSVGKTGNGISTNSQSVQLKRNLGSHDRKVWEVWWSCNSMVGKTTLVAVLGCLVFTAIKILSMQFGWLTSLSRWNSAKLKANTSALLQESYLDHNKGPAFINGSNMSGRLWKWLGMFKWHFRSPTDSTIMQSSWPTVDSVITLRKRSMPVEEAEALMKQWQAIKAQALGYNHETQSLSEILAETMLVQWQDLAESAKVRSCFWRFVLLQLSVLRADIFSDGIGGEMAEIEAVLEEAAELVDGSQPKNTSYYSTYKIQYFLKRQDDGTWRFCQFIIQTPR